MEPTDNCDTPRPSPTPLQLPEADTVQLMPAVGVIPAVGVKPPYRCTAGPRLCKATSHQLRNAGTGRMLGLGQGQLP